MKKFSGYERGMGIGGWLTNYKRFNILPENWRLCLSPGDFEHFESYISKRDVEYIASLGMDHIRLGFDQIVMEESPGIYRVEIWRLIDKFIEHCNASGINLVLNLHKAIGNYCDIQEPVSLLDDSTLQERFIDLWLAFEERYSNQDGLVFELLNEVRNVDPEKWNRLARRTVEAIRKKNHHRKIVVGGINWNSPDSLKYLPDDLDENVIYTWHVYAPFEFTHQRGVLQAPPLYYNRVMHYPSEIAPYNDFHRFVYGKENHYKNYNAMNIDFLRDHLQAAFDYAKKHPERILWCGEFGTIRHAPLASRENYMEDIIRLLKEHDIAYCVWNYLSTANDGNRFSLVDDDKREILSKRLADIIAGH